jgi:carbon-monoxide dehydrogenase small subunit
MKLPLILNGDDVTLDGDTRESLFTVLKREAGVFVEKAPCHRGTCGRCHVLLDSKEVPSCVVPFFQARQREVVTPEGFRYTDEYRQFKLILDEEGLVECAECTDAQMFHLFSYLELFPTAGGEECRLVIGEIPCRCGSRPVLERGAARWLDRKEAARAGRH